MALTLMSCGAYSAPDLANAWILISLSSSTQSCNQQRTAWRRQLHADAVRNGLKASSLLSGPHAKVRRSAALATGCDAAKACSLKALPSNPTSLGTVRSCCRIQDSALARCLSVCMCTGMVGKKGQPHTLSVLQRLAVHALNFFAASSTPGDGSCCFPTHAKGVCSFNLHPWDRLHSSSATPYISFECCSQRF